MIQIFAIVGVLLAIVTYWIIPEVKNTSQTTVLSDLREVLGNSRVILSCIFAGLMVGPLEGFADVWATAFLKQVYGFDGTLAASLPSMIFIGMCVGAPILSLIAEKVRSYQGTIIGAGLIMVLSFSLILSWHLSSSMISLNFILIGICCAYQILAIYKISTYVPEHIAGLTTAIANMIIMIFGYAFHSTMGGVINSTGGPSTVSALIQGVSVIPIALSIGTLGFIGLAIKDYSRKPVRLPH